MQIFVTGSAKHSIAPDQITASVNFNVHADSYDDALKNGVQTVKDYFKFIEDNTDFKVEEFKTLAYSIHERFHTNHLSADELKNLDLKDLDPKSIDKKLNQRVSDGFFFQQFAYIEFDFNRERLAKLLVLTSKKEDAPHFDISFGLKDPKAYQRGLIGDAYRDAQRKAETLAAAADKHLRDCVRVDIDHVDNGGNRYYEGAIRSKMSAGVEFDRGEVENEIQAIDDTFQPDPIEVSKSIDCVWETCD